MIKNKFPSEKIESGVYTMGQVKDAMKENFRVGKVRGETTGFPELDPYFSWKLGEVTCVTGWPQSGKTTLMLFMMMWKAVQSGWKSCIFCPENMGVDRKLRTSPDDIFDELIESYVGKPINQQMNGCMTIEEYEKAIEFLKEFFYVVYPEEDHTIDCVTEYQRHICMKYKCKFVFSDPFNSFDNDFKDREDQFIRRYLLKRNKFAKIHGVCDITSVHPSGKSVINDNVLDHPTQWSLAGGNMWNNKCDNILSINRPYYPQDPKTEFVEFHSLKIKKQKLVGYPGVVPAKFVRKENRFYFEKTTPF